MIKFIIKNIYLKLYDNRSNTVDFIIRKFEKQFFGLYTQSIRPPLCYLKNVFVNILSSIKILLFNIYYFMLITHTLDEITFLKHFSKVLYFLGTLWIISTLC